MLFSCSEERETFHPSAGNNTELAFGVNLPASSPGTYALTATDENKLAHVYVLAFKAESGQYKLYDWAETGTIQDNGEISKKKFTVTFTRLKQNEAYRFVLLGNAKPEVNALFDGGTGEGAEKNAMLAQLQLSGIARWNNDPDSNGYRDIPMWGEASDDKTITPGLTVAGLKLLRMAARIDVTVGEPAQPDFKLKTVHLYNSHQKARIAPDPANLAAGSLSKVEKPTLAAGSNVVKGPLDYTVSNDISLESSIYTFESEVPYENSIPVTDKMTCLVVGGVYGNDATPTYYRIDLVKQEDDNTLSYRDILRNHRYTVRITKVKGQGYQTAEEAFNAKAVNIEAEVIALDEADITGIVSDGQYWLAVSQETFTFSRDSRTALSKDNTLTVKTDYPGGWSAKQIADGGNNPVSWLSVSSAGGYSGSTDIKLILEENTGSDRTAYIYLKAGRLVYKVTVTQTITSGIELYIKDAGGNEISELFFREPIGVQPAAQKFGLFWFPATSDVTVSSQMAGTTPFTFDITGGSDKPVTFNNGSGEIWYNTILPPAISGADVADDPFKECISRFDFTIYNGQRYMTKSLFLRQATYNLVVTVIDGFYHLDGSNYMFAVESNTGWRIKSVTDNSSLLNLQGQDNLIPGVGDGNNTSVTYTPIRFTVKNRPTDAVSDMVTIVLESTETQKKFNDVTLNFNLMGQIISPPAHKGWAGSNIYYDQTLGHLTFDDVGVTDHMYYNGVIFKWGSLYGISPIQNYTVLTKRYPPDGGTTTGGSYDDIPFISDATNVPSNRDRAYLYEVTDGNSGKGDICRWLTKKGYAPAGKKWRMPTSREFDGSYTYQTGTFGNHEYGTGAVRSGVSKTGTAAFFPMSHYRHCTGALQESASTGNGYYWTASPGGTNAYLMKYSNKFAGIFNGADIYHETEGRCRAHPVRCVVE
ncbi:hypothetical protein JCM30204_54190 [Dysgonomonas termitidis]